MKKTLTIMFFIALFSTGLTSAQDYDWRVEFYPKIRQGALDVTLTGDVKISVYFENINRDDYGWSTPFQFYTVGFARSTAPGRHYVNPEFKDLWDIFTSEYEENWDGDLTTPVKYGFVGVNFFSVLPSPLNIKLFDFVFNIESIGLNCDMVVANLCIDSTSCQNSSYDWIFYEPMNFGGPYCIPIVKHCCNQSLCGDLNDDSNVNILDLTRYIQELYTPNTIPLKVRCGDFNTDGRSNIIDITAMINYLYNNGPALNCE